MLLLRILDRLEEILIATLMALATTIIFIAVMHRYLIGIPLLYPILFPINLSWAQELCIYMFIWMAKIGAAYGVRTGIHVGVDVLINALSAAWRRKFIVFGLLAGALFTGVVAAFAIRFVFELYFTEQVSADLEMPMWLVYMGLPIGSSLMCFRFLQVCWSFIQTGEFPRPDHAKVEGLDQETDPIIAAIEKDENLRMGGKS
jgi:C4-dicarboxylate transporter, DctQ subunit